MREPWVALSEIQQGVVARSQLLGQGLSARQVRRHVDNGRWQVLWPGVYVTHSGPVPELTRVWGAVLYGGPGAVAGPHATLGLARLWPGHRGPIDVCVPHERRVQARAGLTIHRVRDLARRARRTLNPPQLRIEHAVLDVADAAASPETVCDVVLRTLQRRLVTTSLVADGLAARPRHRWRRLVTELLAEFADGVHSPLERRYLREVERAHRLPRGVRNQLELSIDGRRRYRDVRYEKWLLVVELDGREAHPVDEAFRDLRRDNAVVAGGEVVLRYGWRDVTAHSCEVAAQVAAVLAVAGWRGSPSLCGASCRVRQDRGRSVR
ncbi:hypothetical protein [Kineosporia sp. NBRC 101731]|uniref:hypothetical protein n=1 Tax=Kineosporia sp. NBRC 101731 TaxID=3032199 RepID=UPI0024A14B0A|nr:hypothetical protein [Kineosporia sp. NBRC 101731]GLY33636.1 hypothetical protein Kisp02_70010 [Kineosporia sp. NBRC 101731]